MEIRSVEILGMCITQKYGALTTGDQLIDIDADFAKHLVEECKAAKYIDEPAPETEKPAKKTAKKAHNGLSRE